MTEWREFSGGKSDSKNSKRTPSLNNPKRDYYKLCQILHDKGAYGDKGMALYEVTDEYTKRHGEKTMYTIGAKLGRLVAKKIIIARPKPGNSAAMLYSLPIKNEVAQE